MDVPSLNLNQHIIYSFMSKISPEKQAKSSEINARKKIPNFPPIIISEMNCPKVVQNIFVLSKDIPKTYNHRFHSNYPNI